MDKLINVYCDESCHLENDKQKAMVLGCVVLPQDMVKIVSDAVKAIKFKHGVYPMNEIKWIKVSQNKYEMYKEIYDYFITNECLQFRAVLIPDKALLNHEAFDQTQEAFYFKMFYYVIKEFIRPDTKYKIYYDYKDMHENKRIIDLNTYLVKYGNIESSSIQHQLVHSHESQLIQLADLLIGAVSYKARMSITENAKSSMIKLLEQELHIKLEQTTSHNDKFSILRWKAR